MPVKKAEELIKAIEAKGGAFKCLKHGNNDLTAESVQETMDMYEKLIGKVNPQTVVIKDWPAFSKQFLENFANW